LRGLDAGGHRFHNAKDLVLAVQQMRKQWLGLDLGLGESSEDAGGEEVHQTTSHKYKELILYFLQDFHFHSSSLVKCTEWRSSCATGVTSNRHAAQLASSSDSLAHVLPYTMLTEPCWSIELEHIDTLLHEVALATVQSLGSVSHHSSSFLCPEYLLLIFLRSLTSSSPRFESSDALQRAIQSMSNRWNAMAVALHSFLNDSRQCDLLPSLLGTLGEQDERDGNRATSHSPTSKVNMEQVQQLMLGSGAFGGEIDSLLSADDDDDVAPESSSFERRFCRSPLLPCVNAPIRARSTDQALCVAIPRVNDLLDHLVELDASGRTFHSRSQLLDTLRARHARIQWQKRQAPKLLITSIDNGDGVLARGIPPPTSFDVDLLYASAGTGLRTLPILRRLHKSKLQAPSLAALIEAVTSEHRQSISNKQKLHQWLLQPSHAHFFRRALLSVPCVAGAQDGTNHGVSPIKVSFPLVSRLYSSTDGGASTLQYVESLLHDPPPNAFTSLQDLGDEVKRRINRDRVRVWMEDQVEGGTLFRPNASTMLNVHEDRGGVGVSSASLTDAPMHISDELIDSFITASGTGPSTLMYLKHIARLCSDPTPTVSPDHSPSTAYASSVEGHHGKFRALFELVPILQSMHKESMEARKRAMQLINDLKEHALLVYKHDDDEIDGSDDDEPDNGDDTQQSKPAASSLSTHVRTPSQSIVRRRSISSAEVDYLFEQSGSHPFTLLHLQSLIRLGCRFDSIKRLLRAIQTLEHESLKQREEVLLFLSFVSPPLVSASRKHVAGSQPIDVAGRERTHRSIRSATGAIRADVDALFLQSSAGANIMSYLRDLHAGRCLLPYDMLKVGDESRMDEDDGSPVGMGSPVQFNNMAELTAAVSLIHEKHMDARIRVWRFLDSPQRCTLFARSSSDHVVSVPGSAPDIPLSGVDALFDDTGAGLLTYPLILALQSTGHQFEQASGLNSIDLSELCWMIRSAYEDWDVAKRDVLNYLLMTQPLDVSATTSLTSKAPSINTNNARRPLLDFGGSTIDPRTNLLRQMPWDELITISDIDSLFEQTQAGRYMLAHVRSLDRDGALGNVDSFRSWRAFVEALGRKHTSFVSSLRKLLDTHRNMFFKPSVAPSAEISTASVATNFLQAPHLRSAAAGVGLAIAFYLKFMVHEQASIGSFPLVSSLDELAALVADLHTRDLDARHQLCELLHDPRVGGTLLRRIAGGMNAPVVLSMVRVHRLADMSGVCGVWLQLHTERLAAMSRRFHDLDALALAIADMHEQSRKDRRELHSFINDHGRQSLFADANARLQKKHADQAQATPKKGGLARSQVAPAAPPSTLQFSPSDISDLYIRSGCFSSILPLLRHFDSMSLQFASLADLTHALRSLQSRDAEEKAKLARFFSGPGRHIIIVVEKTESEKADEKGLTSKTKEQQRANGSFEQTGMEATFDALGMVPPPKTATAFPSASFPTSVSSRDIDELYALCRLGSHLLRMLHSLVDSDPDRCFSSVSALAQAVNAQFEQEAECKRQMVRLLKNEFQYGPDAKDEVPSDIETAVDQFAEVRTWRYLQRLHRRQSAAAAVLDGQASLLPPPMSFPTAASVFAHVNEWMMRDQNQAFEILRFLRDPLRCGIFARSQFIATNASNSNGGGGSGSAKMGMVESIDGHVLEQMLTILEAEPAPNVYGGRSSAALCDSYEQLFKVVQSLERKGVQVTSVAELQQACANELRQQHQHAAQVLSFLNDSQCRLFASSSATSSKSPFSSSSRATVHNIVPSDFVSRVLGADGSFLHGRALHYLRLLNIQHARSGAEGFRTSDEALAALRALVDSHASARRAIFLFLNDARYCTLIQPFHGEIAPKDVDRIADDYLSLLISGQAAQNGEKNIDVSSALLDLHSMLLAMQNAGMSFPSFAVFASYCTSAEAIQQFRPGRVQHVHPTLASSPSHAHPAPKRTESIDIASVVSAAKAQHRLDNALEQVAHVEARLKQMQVEREMESQAAAANIQSKQDEAHRQQMERTRERLAEVEAERDALRKTTRNAAWTQSRLAGNDRLILVDYISNSALFSDTLGEASMSSGQLDELSLVGGGLSNTLLILKELDSTTSRPRRSFQSFDQLLSTVREQANKQGIASASRENSKPRAQTDALLAQDVRIPEEDSEEEEEE